MTNAPDLPIFAITMGDPSGVGPEVVLKALRHASVYEKCRPLVFGDRRILKRAASWLDGEPLEIEVVEVPGEADYRPGTISLLDFGNAAPEDCPVAQVAVASGQAAYEYVCRACDLTNGQIIAGIVTAPLCKESMNLAGHHYPGHTELVAERSGAESISTLLVGPTLRIIHVSVHVSLEEAIRRVTKDRVLEVIDLAQSSCLMLGIEQPRIGIAGLNPHASEGGLFGTQEQDHIQPAIEVARGKGYTVSDPQPGDTVFMRAVKGEFDIVVAMYHDQGHIPMKLLSFEDGVNVSVGLPIIRTSVDHGTAFDIAGTGQADEGSLLAAIDVAAQMAAARFRNANKLRNANKR